MKDFKKKSFLMFDLDGVVFDSKKNMELAWNETSKKFGLNIAFSLYFKKIGMPFLKILESLGIKPNKIIYKYFKEVSLKKINTIKPYKDVLNLFRFLKKKKLNFRLLHQKILRDQNFY